ncbi:tight junction protein ZO-1 [Trichonephila inaurata madagascariensis]|uniref:Tight junction protein ZO-1 n=1 Tax=Trichonephila inaurata madagascariensis TaxID=2747483 RepID=A0A8X6YSI8_9ARAC|nr:tight junction protein ZO-1 [Trichonephila inaurata madagascariensis]
MMNPAPRFDGACVAALLFFRVCQAHGRGRLVVWEHHGDSVTLLVFGCMKTLCFGLLDGNASASQGSERAVWEYHTVNLSRVSGYGFGVAVNGGKDNPQFSNGDPAITISDVLKAGPAEGKLLIGDRLVSANGISLENVDYTRAVQVLRECGNSVNLVIKRKVNSTNVSSSSSSVKVTLTKSRKKDSFGIVLGCRIYVKEITNQSSIEKDGSIQEGDIILKINSNSTDSMTLKEAKKIIENTKEKLQLVLKRDTNQMPEINQNGQQITSNCDSKIPSPVLDTADEKNNLTRLQSGRNRGPLMDISLSQLDQPATPLLTGHGHSRAPVGLDEEESLQRPPLPRIDEFTSRRDQFDDDPLARRNKTVPPEPRFISFQKDGSVGIRLTGGNEVGVFVTAVQPGSPASLQGLQPGDKILKVNDMDMNGVTREEAVLFLLHIQDFVNLIVQHMKEDYDEIVANQRGDSFYVRTHFSYEGSGKGELGFHVGEVFHVINTLHNGVVGSWLVHRLGRTNQEIQKGVIPNSNRAEQWAQEQQNQAKKDAASESRGSFFKRRSARRSKSLSKDHWEDVVFADGISKFPAYERVTLKHPGFIRPVVLFGSLADVARDKLLKDYPDKYASPQLDGHLDDISKSQKSSGIIRLSAIKEIVEKGKHAILDITPSAVDRLNYAQFYPIVIFMRAENKHVVKELRSRLAKSSHKSSKKLHDHAVKLEKLWSHVFTATITLTSADMWYKKLRETIDKQQQQSIWISESKPEEAISDDFLFPMTSRLSYASSPESDLELANDSRPSDLQDLGLQSNDRHMVKASSDPSIATQDEMSGPPGYNQLSGFSTARSRQLPFEFLQQQDALTLGSDLRDSAIPAKYNPGGETALKARTTQQPEPPPRVDRASKPTHYRTAQERLFARGRHSLLLEGNPTPREPPDYINTGAQPYSLERSNGRLGAFDSSSYSSDSYNQYSTNPNDKKREPYAPASAISSRSSHDPYRYSRNSTQQPPKPMNVDRGRAPPPVNKYRYPDERPAPPSPPPKPANYQQRMSDGRPVPPPKPGQYQSSRPWREDESSQPQIGTIRTSQQQDFSTPSHHSSEIMPPPYTPNQRSRNSLDFMGSPPYYTPRSYPPPNDMMVLPPKHSPVPEEQIRNAPIGSPSRRHYKSTDDNSGFDSGRGSSLDRNYDVRSYTKAMGNPPSWPAVHMNGGGPYHNVPYRGRRDPMYPPPYDHHSSPPQPPPSSLIDLSNRENRGSAFELYKKPDSRSPMALHSMPNGERSK